MISGHAPWRKGIAQWMEGNTALLSVPFTWLLPLAYQQCVWFREMGYRVRAGGPAVSLRPDFLAEVAEIGGEVDALPRHNPDATVTSRGCPNKCSFCAVPTIEGDLRELADWEPRSIVCDNNLLACSPKHFDRVIDRLKPVRDVDFNQGLDARLLTAYHADRLAELHLSVARLAWDKTDEELAVMEAIATLNRAGIGKRRIQVYVLFGFDDSPEDAWYRFEMLKAKGIRPNAMRYQPLTAMRRNDYRAPGWTERQLRDTGKFWNRQRWLGGVDFADYRSAGRRTRTDTTLHLSRAGP